MDVRERIEESRRGDEDHGGAHFKAAEFLAAGEGARRVHRTVVLRLQTDDADTPDDEGPDEDHKEGTAIGLQAQDHALVDGEDPPLGKNARLHAEALPSDVAGFDELRVEGAVDPVVVLRTEVEGELVSALKVELSAHAREEVAHWVSPSFGFDDGALAHRGEGLDHGVHWGRHAVRVGLDLTGALLEPPDEEGPEAAVVSDVPPHVP